MNFKKNIGKGGFTLIEVLLVIAILAILAAIVIVAINPAKQFGQAQNAQRQNDVRAILDALHQYSLDNAGIYPGSIMVGDTCLSDGNDICQPGVDCGGTMLDELMVDEIYLTTLPSDPTGADENITGYYVIQTPGGRVSVCSMSTYDDVEISVTR